MRAILRKLSTKQIAGYVLLTLLTLLFMGSFVSSDNQLYRVISVLVSIVWAMLSAIGFGALLKVGFSWAMGE